MVEGCGYLALGMIYVCFAVIGGGVALDALRNERGCQLKSLRGVTLGGG